MSEANRIKVYGVGWRLLQRGAKRRA